jgi:hypothetical protein
MWGCYKTESSQFLEQAPVWLLTSCLICFSFIVYIKEENISMGVIRTALEIALERSEEIKGDKSSIDQFEMKQRGKKLACDFLAGGADITEEVKKTPANQRESLKQGIFDILVTQIALPVSKDDEKRIEKIGQGLATVIEKKEFSVMFKQLTQIMGQYLQEVSNYEQAIRQQYSPKLRQKEEELSRRLGREVRIDPMQDPEFIAFYNQNITALRGNYEAVIEQAKEEARRMLKETV